MDFAKKLTFALFLLSVLATSSCRKDPCDAIYCLNGGYCANGLCNCPTGYTGSDCGTEMQPVSMTVTRITLTRYPATEANGGGWDLTSGPDVYLSMNQGTSSNSNNYITGYVTNATSSLNFDLSTPKVVTNLSSNWVIGVWDYDDLDSDDLMSGVYFIPNDFKAGFPESFVLNTNSLTMTVYVTWGF